MTTDNRQVRRATVDDVPKLVALWDKAQVPARELEQRFREFQIVENQDGTLACALGFQILGTEGRLFQETFDKAEEAEALRALLWERIQIQARNHGLVRIWTWLDSPFWISAGLQPASEEILAKLPESFAEGSKPWCYIQLRPDLPAVSLDKEFNLFKEASREQSEKILRQARVVKMIAGTLSVVLFLVILILAVLFFRAQTGQRITPAGP